MYQAALICCLAYLFVYVCPIRLSLSVCLGKVRHQDKRREGKINQHQTRQDRARHKTWHATRQDKARYDKTRQDKRHASTSRCAHLHFLLCGLVWLSCSLCGLVSLLYLDGLDPLGPFLCEPLLLSVCLSVSLLYRIRLNLVKS